MQFRFSWQFGFLTALKLLKLAVQIKRLSISTFCEENTFHASRVLRWRGCWRSTWWPGGRVAPCRALHSNRPPSDVRKMCTSRGGLWKGCETWCSVGCWLDGGAGHCRGEAPAVNLTHYYSQSRIVLHCTHHTNYNAHSLHYNTLITLHPTQYFTHPCIVL